MGGQTNPLCLTVLSKAQVYMELILRTFITMTNSTSSLHLKIDLTDHLLDFAYQKMGGAGNPHPRLWMSKMCILEASFPGLQSQLTQWKPGNTPT